MHERFNTHIPQLQHRVGDVWQPLVKGLNDDGIPARIRAQQRPKVRHQLQRQEVVCVGDLQCFEQAAEAVVAEPGVCVWGGEGDREGWKEESRERRVARRGGSGDAVLR